MASERLEHPKLICFDLNKTLIEENSWRDLNLEMGVTPEEDDLLVSWGKEGIISDAEGQRILAEIYKKRGDATQRTIAEILHNYAYMPEAEELVSELRRRGYDMALISGSMDVLVEQVAHELGITEWAANNQFIFDDNEHLQEIRTIDNDVTYKLHQLQRICDEKGIVLGDCLCVGDGANDRLLFEATNCGVTFEGSPIEGSAKHVIRNLGELAILLA
jgi:phosphoserine phosphatase